MASKKDDAPTSFYLYSRETGKVEFLFHDRPELAEYHLAPMEPLVIRARDGLNIFLYLTLPASQVSCPARSISFGGHLQYLGLRAARAVMSLHIENADFHGC